MTTRAARKELIAKDYYCKLIKYLSGKEYVRLFPRHKHLKIVSEALDAIREFIQNSVPPEIQTLADQHRRKDRGNDGAGGGSGGSGDAGVSTGGSGLTAVKAGAN